jgi:hypothetical protein
MADTSGISPYLFSLEGGLVLNKPNFTVPPGAALQLENFEPDVSGGYRRIDGYQKWNSNLVPHTASTSEPVLMSAFFGGQVIAARGEKVYKAGSTGSWTEIDSGRTGANKYTFEKVNFAGTKLFVYADGANFASYYDGTSVVDVNTTDAPADPQYIASFKNTAFYAGMSASPHEVVYAAPLTINDFTSGHGAGSFAVDSAVTGMIVFRDSLYIFSATRIYRLTGSTSADFALTPITRDIGCRNGWTIKEFAGDVIFLGPDGLRTIAGTEKIGDVSLASVSRPVQELFRDKDNVSDFDAYVLPQKTQYRLIFNEGNNVVKSLTTGVICSVKDGGYEFATTKGLQTNCSDTDAYQGEYYTFFGGRDGYVYRDQKGDTFDGSVIVGRYRSPDITAGDPGVRKSFQRVIMNYAPEGIIRSDLYLRYDYESSQSPRPEPYPIDSSRVVALYGSSAYGTATYGGQTDPLVRQAVEGSGFSVALRVIDSGECPPYSLKGFSLEFNTAARR